jgi:hypothetical protein
MTEGMMWIISIVMSCALVGVLIYFLQQPRKVFKGFYKKDNDLWVAVFEYSQRDKTWERHVYSDWTGLIWRARDGSWNYEESSWLEDRFKAPLGYQGYKGERK